MDRAGDDFLAGAALAREEDRALRRGDFPDELDHLAHCAALADETFEIILRLHLAAEHLRLPDELPVLEEPVDLREEFVEGERLQDVVRGTAPERLDGGVDAAL